ncbi:sodium/bile acid cotransporter-like isoform X1 [Myripristis murdjan]|uniref:sodium/bile acid cotransporter-like isoform X1 n=1 Tax=Myripristis murdjan TaxID=586833 RepID=UPI001175F61F|nr:sodium/bile acid cotransporter-like isoform X1 [Myripristis murdjan]
MNLTEGLSAGKPSFNASGDIFLNGSTGFQNLDLFSPTLNRVLNYCSSVVLFIAMVSLGCTMEIHKIKAHIVKPKGVAIALLAQFGIMPMTAFILAKIFQLGPMEAVTVLICGCCPGGTISNILALALKCDMNLSILMTTCSTFAALGMTPLLLFIYSQGFNNLQRAVPFTSIAIILAATVTPCAMGITINHYKPKYSPYILKGGLFISLISFAIIIIISYISIGGLMWVVFSPQLISMAMLMPLIGFTLGYALSTVLKLNHQCRKTVSMETGCQSVQLCGAILKLAFPPEVIGALFLFPLLYLTFQLGEGLLLVVLFRCHQTLKPPAEETKVNQSVDGKVMEVTEVESQDWGG